MKVKSLSRVRLLATPWTAAYQAPLSMGFSRQKYWSGVPLPSPVPKADITNSSQNSFLMSRDPALKPFSTKHSAKCVDNYLIWLGTPFETSLPSSVFLFMRSWFSLANFQTEGLIYCLIRYHTVPICKNSVLLAL